jgi:hypothetical protein
MPSNTNKEDNQDNAPSPNPKDLNFKINPEILMINNEIEKIIEISMNSPLSEEDLKRLDSLIKMRALLIDRPAIIYVKSYEDVYDRTILSTLKRKKPSKRTLNAQKKAKNNTK